jgi:hypothetical protein
MSVYQHPSITRLVEETSSAVAGPSSTSLVLDHLLYQHTNARFRLARRELGMDPPQRIEEWVGESEAEEEETMESLLGYGNGRLGKKKGKGRATDEEEDGHSARAKPRRGPRDDWHDEDDPGRAENDERAKSEGMERMLAALLGKLSMEDDDESDEDEPREAR